MPYVLQPGSPPNPRDRYLRVSCGHGHRQPRDEAVGRCGSPGGRMGLCPRVGDGCEGWGHRPCRAVLEWECWDVMEALGGGVWHPWGLVHATETQKQKAQEK